MIERRLTQVLVLFGVLNLVVVAHLARLQIVERGYWVAQGEDNRSRRIFTPQLRGSIRLADGTVVARSEYRYDLVFRPGRFRDRWAPGALTSLLRKLELKGGFWATRAEAVAEAERRVAAAEAAAAHPDETLLPDEAEAATNRVRDAREELEALFDEEAAARARLLRSVVEEPDAAWERLLAVPAFAIRELVEERSDKPLRELHLDGGASRQLASVLGPRTYTRLKTRTDPEPEAWTSVAKALKEGGSSPDPKRLRRLRREAEAYVALTRALPDSADHELWLGVLQAERNARRQLRGPKADRTWWLASLSELGREKRMRYRKVAGDHLSRTRYPYRRLAYEAVASLDRAAFEKRLSGLGVVEQTGRRVIPLAPHLVGLTGAVPQNWLATFRDGIRTEGEGVREEDLEGIWGALADAGAVRRGDVERRQRWIANSVGPRGHLHALAFGALEDALLLKPHAGDRNVGLSGVERWYQSRLHGRKGVRRFVHVPGRNRPIMINDTPPVNGRSVTLTLDADLQRKAAALLAADRAKRPRNDAEVMKGGGGLVALDPRTGRILVLATDPTYDPKDLASASAYRTLDRLEPSPLRDRTLMVAVPGSIFKPFTALAGLEAGVIAPNTGLPCWGGVSGGPPKCAHRGHHHGAPAAANRLADALCHSCNAYFAIVGKRLVERKKRETFRSLFERLHLHENLIHGPRHLAYRGRAWIGDGRVVSPANIGEARNMGIGQDPVMISPLQAAALYAVLARGGIWRHPFLVEESPHAKRPEERVAAAAHVRAIRAGLARVTRSGGTAWGHPEAQRVWRALDRAGIRVAGKTGSATRGTSTTRIPKHAWFASFAPLRDPEIVVVVFLEGRDLSGGFGAAPIAAAFLEHYFRDRLGALSREGDGR